MPMPCSSIITFKESDNHAFVYRPFSDISTLDCMHVLLIKFARYMNSLFGFSQNIMTTSYETRCLHLRMDDM